MIKELIQIALFRSLEGFYNDEKVAHKETKRILKELSSKDIITHKILTPILKSFSSRTEEDFFNIYGLELYKYEHPEEHI